MVINQRRPAALAVRSGDGFRDSFCHCAGAHSSLFALLRTESLDGGDAGGAAGGKPAGDQGAGDEQKSRVQSI